jgi:hypothetical protein
VNRIPERNRPLVILATGVVVLLLVAGGVLVLGQLGPSPTPPPSTSPSNPTSPSPDAATPEGGTRAFFDAFARARLTDDPSIVEPFVTGTTSSAYLTVDAFLRGQKDAGKASVITTNELSGFGVDVQGETATVMVTQQLGGYDIDIDTGEPRESPTLLPATDFRVVLKKVGNQWLVEEFEPLQ